MSYVDLSQKAFKLALIDWACHRLALDPASVTDAWIASQRAPADVDRSSFGVTVYVAWMDDRERKVSHFNCKEGEAAASIRIFRDRALKVCPGCGSYPPDYEAWHWKNCVDHE